MTGTVIAAPIRIGVLGAARHPRSPPASRSSTKQPIDPSRGPSPILPGAPTCTKEIHP